MFLKRFFPILDWLPKYNTNDIKNDFSAGLVIGIMFIPQGMAYAMLAGLNPIYGLYAAIFPQLAYAIFGTSRHLSVGPVALDALIIAATLKQFEGLPESDMILLAAVLAFLEGMVLFILGMVRLGTLVNFLSVPIISGFTSAAALIISVSQLKHLMGVDLGSGRVDQILWTAIMQIPNINIATLLVGLGGIAIIVILKRINKKIPTPLVVVVVSIVVVWIGNLSQFGVKIVGTIPDGLPPLDTPHFDYTLAGVDNMILALLPSAFILAFIAFMQSFSISKVVQAEHKNYILDANQELRALGTANMLGSFFQGFSIGGSLSRTVVNSDSGGKTNMSSLVSAAFVVVVLIFLTPLFYYLPKAVLGSIIITAVMKLINVGDAVNMWRYHRKDFFVLLLTFIATIIDLKIGILCGLVLALLFYFAENITVNLFIWKGLKPSLQVAEITDSPTTALRVSIKQDVYFANIAYIRNRIKELQKNTDYAHYYINTPADQYLDSSTARMWKDLQEDFAREGCSLNFECVPLALKTITRP